MRHLIQAELLKLRTTRSFWLYMAAALAFVPVTVALAVTGAGAGRQHAAGEQRRRPQRLRLGSRRRRDAAADRHLHDGRRVPPQHRHVDLPDHPRPTSRRRCEARGVGLVGFVIGLAASSLTLAIALPWLSAKDVDLTAYTGDMAVVLLGVLLATTLSPIVGVGFGALVPNQTVAVTAALVWITTVEGLLVSFRPEVGRWLPGGASSALTGTATINGGLLPIWGGALLFAAYGLAFAVAGSRLVLRRDIA